MVRSLCSTEGYGKEEHKTDHVDTEVSEQCNWMCCYFSLYTSESKTKKDLSDVYSQSHMSNSRITCVLSKVCVSDLNSK